MAMQDQSVSAMLAQQVRIANTQEQLATGLKVVRPSDNPAAAVRSLILDESVELKDQYQVNIGMARGRLAQEDVVLGGVVDVMQRLHELGVRALNGSLNAKDRQSMESETRELLNEISSLSNTKTSTGEYLFAGLNSKTVAFTGSPVTGGYVYGGDSGRRSTAIGEGYTINDNDPGDAVFTVAAPAVPVGFPPAAPENIMNLVFQFAEHLAANQPDSSDLANLQLSLEQVSARRTSVGARLVALDQQEELNAKLTTDEKALLSKTRDLDYTEAISRLNLETTALEAAQQAYSKVQKLSLFNYL
jgi:flagellar hook-associated protein 3 FlgL